MYVGDFVVLSSPLIPPSVTILAEALININREMFLSFLFTCEY